jgi:hypothetical protein
MGDSRIKDVSSLLSAFFDGEKIRRGERYSDFFSSWSTIVGDRLAAHSRIVDVDKGLLVIEAEHPGWIQLLQMRQTGILENVARRFPELSLRGIVFRVTGQGGTSIARGVAPSPAGAEETPEAAIDPAEEENTPNEPYEGAGKGDPEFQKLFESLKRTMRGKG